MKGSALIVLVCLVADASCGRKKENKEKEREEGGEGGCQVQYFQEEEVHYKTKCSDSYRTECSTTYKTKCSTKTYTSYNTECSTHTVQEPVQQCSTSYTTECYQGRSKRGTKKDRKEKNQTTEPSTSSVKCHRGPHQSCTQSSRSRDVKTCHQVPVESQREECDQVPQQTCSKVPSKTCQKVAVRVPVRMARRVCHINSIIFFYT